MFQPSYSPNKHIVVPVFSRHVIQLLLEFRLVARGCRRVFGSDGRVCAVFDDVFIPCMRNQKARLYVGTDRYA